MRYTVLDRHATPLAMIAMGAAAWKIAPRDHAIGWSPETRARNLYLVVNQSRLLLLPWIVIPNLGSHILSLLRRQLPGDWTRRYNVEPVLMETFVETPRFAGTVYKAANWTHIGTTRGRRTLRHQKPARPAEKAHLALPTPQRLEAHPQPLSPIPDHRKPDAHNRPRHNRTLTNKH